MLARKQMVQTFKEAQGIGPYDEVPVLPAGIDPQLHLSRNDHAQPFYLVCEKDTVLVTMSGRGLVRMKDSPVSVYKLKPGDFIYIPGGTPHQIVPDGETVTYRYKAEISGREATAWYCDDCGTRLAHMAWETSIELPQEGYLRMCQQFNANEALRTCSKCGRVHPTIDLAPYRWADIARALRSAPGPTPAAA